MPYDPGLAARLADLLASRNGMQQKKMFGGIGWLLNGNMCVGVYKEFLILRVGAEIADKLLKRPYIRPMDITGKPMKGWTMVAPKGYEEKIQLRSLIDSAIRFVSTLPPK